MNISLNLRSCSLGKVLKRPGQFALLPETYMRNDGLSTFLPLHLYL